MILGILIGLAFLLLGGFLLLLAFEDSRDVRFLGKARARFDAQVSRAFFIATHVDWGSLTKHLTQVAYERVLHDAAQGILRLVRIMERTLTRTVRRIRERRGFEEPVEGEEKRSWTKPVRRAVDMVRKAARKRLRRAPRETTRIDDTN